MKIIGVLAQDCPSGMGCPTAYEIDTATGTGSGGRGLMVQGYTITDRADLMALGVRPGESAVRLSPVLVAQCRSAGADLSWLVSTPSGQPAAVGATVSDLEALLEHPVPAGEHAVIPRVP